MTGPLCGTAHHLYPETLCTQPAGHYRRDRDPHGGPLIIDGRERGGAAWDEPQEQQMTDRHTVDTITSDQLDALYDQLDAAHRRIKTLEHVAAGNKRHVQAIVPDLERAEAALDRVRGLRDRARTEAPASQGPTWEGLDLALNDTLPPAPAATELETTARVLSALHRSAADTVTRVIELHEQWVKVGPPPLGASLSRWWDARLVELHNAIVPPAADQTTEK